MDKEENSEASIQVKDRRRFNQDGTLRKESSAESLNEETSGDAQIQANSTKYEKKEFEINFTTFTLSLASSVQISLGLIPHPATGKPEVDLASAKQTIDIMGMLEEKTKGNLDKNEEQILKQILFELRMQYVGLTSKVNKEG